MPLYAARKALLSSPAPFWVPKADNARAAWYVDYTTNRYAYLSGGARMTTYADFASWLTALGGTYSRASTAYRTNASGLLESVGNNVLRFDYDPVTLAPQGILLEGARTNLYLRSQEFNTTWSKATLSVSSDVAAAPDGTTTADKLILNVGVDGTISQSISVSAINHAFSIFVKAGEWSGLKIFARNASDTPITSLVDLLTGAVPTNNHSITTKNVGNGWWRVSFINFSSSGTSSVYISPSINGSTVPNVGDGASGIYVWGAQLEAGSFASSYIPTTSGFATRAADILTFPTSPWFNASAWTLYAEFNDYDTGTGRYPRVVCIDAGSADPEFAIYVNGSPTSAGGYYYYSGGYQSNLSDTGFSSTNGKVATAFALNDAALSVQGQTVKTDNTVTISGTAMTTTRFGTDGTINVLFGHIRKIGYWPFRVANSELQRLTA